MKRLTGSVILMFILAVAVTGFGGITRTVLVRVEGAKNPWVESQLEQKLITHLTRSRDLRAETGRDRDLYPPLPDARYDVDSMINWGIEVGGRYLVYVRIDDERLERRKTFSVPLIFHKWETIGFIEGELRLIDIERGILLTAEPFMISRKAKEIFQASNDDDPTDPALHVNSVEKIRFFDHLEEDATRYLMERISQFIRGR